MRLVHANSSGLTTLQGENAVSPVENGDKTTQKKRATFLQLSHLQWCHRESNQGHKDFQSFALPTEL